MTGVHVYWTKPQLEEDKISYFNDYITQERTLILNKLLTTLSALWWKKLNGPIKLFTDKQGLDLYREYKLDLLYDEIDTELLESYEGNPKLWTAGKIYCMGLQKLPFCFLDNDLIIRQKLKQKDLKKKVGFTHWELPRGLEYQLDDKVLETSGIRSGLSLDFNSLITNTSFFYINSREFQKILFKEHLLNYKIDSSKIDTRIWMYTDQIIPGQIIRNNRTSYFTIDNRLHIPHNSETSKEHIKFSDTNSNTKGEIPAWVLLQKSPNSGYDYEHLWIFKTRVVNNNEFFEHITDRYREEILREFPEMKFLCE